MPNLPKVARVTSYVKNFTKEIEAEFRRRTVRAAEVIRQKERENLSAPGGGKPSAPGEYPRMQSGKLYRGVYTKLSSMSPYSFRVLNKAPYSDFLEYGTPGGKVIVPVRAKALAFTKTGLTGSKTVFTKKVRQGAIKARAQARRTVESCRATLKAIYTRGIPGMLKGNKTTVRLG